MTADDGVMNGGPDKKPAEAMLTASELARLLMIGGRYGVSDQSVRNYARLGMPSAGTDPGRKNPLYLLSVCQRWCDANAAQLGHGGRRRGAGRKKAEEWDSGLARAAEEQTAGDRRGTQAGTAPGTPGGQDPDDLGLLAGEKLKELKLKNEQRALEIEREKGLWVKREDVERSVAELCRAARMVLEAVPGKVAGRIAAAVALGPDHHGLILDLVRQEVEEVMDRLAERQMDK